jgi:hypothetical protein
LPGLGGGFDDNALGEVHVEHGSYFIESVRCQTPISPISKLTGWIHGSI